jgi:hypothetical protein
MEWETSKVSATVPSKSKRRSSGGFPGWLPEWLPEGSDSPVEGCGERFITGVKSQEIWEALI